MQKVDDGQRRLREVGSNKLILPCLEKKVMNTLDVRITTTLSRYPQRHCFSGIGQFNLTMLNSRVTDSQPTSNIVPDPEEL